MSGLLRDLPGKSYAEMARLIGTARVQLIKPFFSTELLLAICWEATLFNNVRQTTGTAVGFGRTELREFENLESPTALAKGYFVPGLPPRKTVQNKITLLGSLNDRQSIQVISGLLCHHYFDQTQNLQAALEAFAGVPFSRGIARQVMDGLISPLEAGGLDPFGVAGRMGKINRWRKCERMLREKPEKEDDPHNLICQAFNAARAFPMDDPAWNRILFPEADPPAESKEAGSSRAPG